MYHPAQGPQPPLATEALLPSVTLEAGVCLSAARPPGAASWAASCRPVAGSGHGASQERSLQRAAGAQLLVLVLPLPEDRHTAVTAPPATCPTVRFPAAGRAHQTLGKPSSIPKPCFPRGSEKRLDPGTCVAPPSPENPGLLSSVLETSPRCRGPRVGPHYQFQG